MSPEIRCRMEAVRAAGEEEANRRRDPYIVLDKLSSLYQAYGPEEQRAADRVIADWALSEDEGLRFDALWLIRQFQIRSAVPALRRLSDRLRGESVPGAPYEHQKLSRLLKDLESIE
jgi:hypothetical protein